jgi:hypothetical protein
MYICGICGFVTNEAKECPRCKMITEETLRDRQRETDALINKIEAFLARDVSEPGPPDQYVEVNATPHVLDAK